VLGVQRARFLAALRRPLGPRRPAALPPTGGKRGLKLKLDDDEDEVEPTSESTRDDLSLLVRSYADTLPFDQSDVFPLERLITARLDRAIAARRRKTSLPSRTAEIARFRRLGGRRRARRDPHRRRPRPFGRRQGGGARGARLPAGAWTFSIRQLLVCPIEKVDAIAASDYVKQPPATTGIVPGAVEINRADRLTRGRFAGEMAWALGYYPALMTGEGRVIRALASARAGRRLSAPFGSLHGGRRA
jgi:hypothetical protein